MKAKGLIYSLVGVGAVVGVYLLLNKNKITSDEAIEIIAKMKGIEDIEKFKRTIRGYQKTLKDRGDKDFAFIDQFMIKRAKAIQNNEDSFTWKNKLYNTKKGTKLNT